MLSAVEGLEVAAPRLHAYVVPITLVVLTALFVVQRLGTAGIGTLLRPDHAGLVRRARGCSGVSHIVAQPGDPARR